MANSKFFILSLKLIAPFFFFVGLFHLIFGPAADIMMGAQISDSSRIDPGLDSQNRFYGVSLSLYGCVLWLAAGDLERYAPILRCSLITIFVAGLARFVSVFLLGWPPLLIGLLFAAEIVLPPIYWFLLSKTVET